MVSGDPDDIDALYQAACARWPSVHVARDRFVTALEERRARDGATGQCAEDLLLALGCDAGDEAALRSFETILVSEVPRALSRMGLDHAESSEILQRVRLKVLVGDDSERKIRTYSAKSGLAPWLRAIAVHEAISGMRAEQRRRNDVTPSVLDRSPASEDPELARLRELYAGPFKKAFAEAVKELTVRDRNVLRLVYLEGLTADQVGLVYDVHRVSVARWLGQIREGLFSRTREILENTLKLSPSDFQSLTRLCLSQLDVSLERILGELDASP